MKKKEEIREERYLYINHDANVVWVGCGGWGGVCGGGGGGGWQCSSI